jgi:SAM-dependent methyltransferase
MPSLSASLLLFANRLLPPVNLPGDTDPHEYARWEYETATGLLQAFDSTTGEVRRALDVGCGYGGKTTRLREHGDRATNWTAVDIAEDHLRHAGTWFARTGHEAIHRTRADAARLPFADGSFDRIVSADVLEHLPEPEATLRDPAVQSMVLPPRIPPRRPSAAALVPGVLFARMPRGSDPGRGQAPGRSRERSRTGPAGP